MGKQRKFYSVRNRCGNPSGSAQRRQMKTISKNIINSSNDMRTQTSKYHGFSVLLFNQLSLYIHLSRECFHLNKLRNNFQKPPRSSIRGHTRHQISEKYTSQNCFQQENDRSPGLQASKYKRKIDLAFPSCFAIVVQDW